MPWLIGAALCLFVLGQVAQAGETIALSVLYAGNPGSQREKDFTALLEKSFAKVGTASYSKFKEEDARAYDVVILDWTSIYPRDEHGKMKETFSGLKSPTPPHLSSRFDRPTILIGAAGGFAAQQSQLKINWL
jgi:hypothetical protein